MKNDLNLVVLSGRLAKNAEVKKENFATGTVAVNRSYFDKDGNEKIYTDFIDFTISGRDKLVPYLVKGQAVIIKGAIHQRKWEQDGKSYSALSVAAEDIEFNGPKPGAKAETAAEDTAESSGVPF